MILFKKDFAKSFKMFNASNGWDKFYTNYKNVPNNLPKIYQIS